MGSRVSGKVVLVTGAALGIGQAVARLMAREGASVAVTDIRDDDGRQLVEQIREQGGTADYWHLDTASEDQVEKVFAAVEQAFGPVNVLVNNAGIAGTNEPTDQIPIDDWERVLAVNVTGVFLCTKHAVPYLRKAGGGSIVNLSSIYGLVGAADLPPYHASKGAVRLMTKNDALLYAGEKIRVNSIHPGFIWTPLVEQLAKESPEGVDAYRAELDGRHPVGHVGEPDDIAYGALYLASDESSFVTGSELVIDGGYTAR